MLDFVLKALFSPFEVALYLKEKNDLSQRSLSFLFFVVCFVITYSIITLVAGGDASLNAVQWLLFTLAGLVLSYVKIFLYTFFTSQKKKELVSYSQILTCSLIANIRLMVIVLFLSLLGSFIDKSLLMILLFVGLFYSLRLKANLFQILFETSSKSLYWISAFQWMIIMPLFMFMTAKLMIVSFQGLLGILF